MTTVNAPAPGRVRRWAIRLAVLGLIVVTAPVWGPVLLMFTIAGFEEFAQRTTVTEEPPGTMPLVAPGRQASVISTGGPCYMCASGTRGSSGWGSSRSSRILLYMIDREAFALLPRTETPRRIQLVALEPMVVLVRDDPSELAPEEGFAVSDEWLGVHGGNKRLWHGTTLPGPIADLSWASPGTALTPVAIDAEGRGVIPLPKGRLVLAEQAGVVTVTRE
ncbi:hypothetical protein [Elioraea rosea]|uniref:hypothetical protein n=1 Tax=Elioraea rosea TaxID=2492390 RepID=UPI001182E691|nr:hypothetical protein [Elioraea rosea]